MPNNVMWLKNTRTGKKVKFAKFYPSTGWYVFHLPQNGIDVIERINAAFDDSRNVATEDDIIGDPDWVLEYGHKAP